MIKSYLINLDKDVDRLAFMSANFQRLGIVFERFCAIDERDFSESAYQHFMTERPRNGKMWLRGQMGCFLSHYNIWKKIAEGSDQFCAVFEDDIHIADELAQVLHNVESIPDEVDLIRLDTSTNRVKLRRQADLVLAGRRFYQVESTSWCTGGYIIHRRAAQRLLDLPMIHHQPSDVLLFNYEESSIAPTFHVLQCFPALCVQDKHLDGAVQFASNIEIDKQSLTLAQLLNHIPTLPSSLWQSLYQSAIGYKRIRFEK